MIEISIVMPVRNAGIYLKEALRSIFAQSFKNFELICVDDASDDGLTKGILQTFQRQSHNMRIITLKAPVGAGEARNIGFSNVKGEYTIFLDADDLFAVSLLEDLYQCIRRNNADVCVCGFEEFYLEAGKKCFCGKYIPDEFYISHKNRERWILDISVVPCNKLCRTHFLEEKNIQFQSLSSCNDVFFSCTVMMEAEKVCCVDQYALIFYRTKTETQISANRNPINLYEAIMLLKATEGKKADNEILLKQLGVLLLWGGIYELKRSHNETNNRVFYALMFRFFQDYPIDFRSTLFNECKEKLKHRPYESKWWLEDMDWENNVEFLLEQFRLTADNLKQELKGSQSIYLWGLGKRGNAFQCFCREENIELQSVADIKNVDIGKTTVYGNKIVHTTNVLKGNGVIAASNRSICEYLYHMNRKMRVLNLEDFYPGGN